MNHSHALPLAPRAFESLRSAPPPWAQRALGTAAAAVFLAGIVSAGLVDSQSGPDGPTLAAPAAATPSGGGAVRAVDHVLLPASLTGTQRTVRRGSTTVNTSGSTGNVARGIGSVPAPPASSAPGTKPTSPPPPTTVDPPAAHGSDDTPVVPALPTPPTLPALPVPADGVTVGPVTVDANTDGASVTVAPGVIAPVTISFP